MSEGLYTVHNATPLPPVVGAVVGESKWTKSTAGQGRTGQGGRSRWAVRLDGTGLDLGGQKLRFWGGC